MKLISKLGLLFIHLYLIKGSPISSRLRKEESDHQTALKLAHGETLGSNLAKSSLSLSLDASGPQSRGREQRIFTPNRSFVFLPSETLEEQLK